MALSLGKITIIVGAGIATTVIAKEGHISTVSDFLSGACKIILRQIANGDTKSSKSHPRNDALVAQVNSLRQELQLLASGRPVTIITSSGGSGPRKYGILIVIIVVGYGYIRWKGFRLPDMMFATKRGLSDACNVVAKQLENVYTSIAATKHHLSEKIDRVDSNLDECASLTSATREEVSELRGDMRSIGDDVQSVHAVVRTLENKIHRIEAKQDLTNDGVRRLVVYARNLQNVKVAERIEGSSSILSRPALEMAPVTPPSRTGSLPPIPAAESPSSTSSSGSGQVRRPLQSAVSDSGLKELYGTLSSSSSQVSDEVVSIPDFSAANSSSASSSTTTTNTTTTTPSLFSRRIGLGASMLTRAMSALQSAK